MICHKFRCLFVHIPKTGGQSIEHFFLGKLGLNWEDRSELLMRPNTDPDCGPERLAHLTAEEYVRCGHLKQTEFDNYFTFSFVRNPWDRLVSAFLYGNYHRHMSFKDFVISGLPERSPKGVYRQIQPQHEYIWRESGELLVDFVGRFESLQADFSVIADRLGFQDSQLPHVNASALPKGLSEKVLNIFRGRSRKRRPPYWEFYDDHTRQLVGDIYRRDIELFSYEFLPADPD
jgi:hypothetical protein